MFKHSSSRVKTYGALWAPYYASVLDLIGSTGVILPIADPWLSAPGETTFTTMGEEQVTFTWGVDSSWSDFDGHTNANAGEDAPYIFEGIIPIVDFNGSNEEADTPDAAYWSRGDGSNDSPVSIGVWANIGNLSNAGYVLSRWTSSHLEWLFGFSAAELPVLNARDNSAGVQSIITSDVAVTQNTWSFVVITYDGTGGSSAFTDPNAQIYINGSKVASTISNNGSYVAMENKTGTTALALNQADSVYFIGKLGGGPLGPFFTQTELTADQVLRLYELGRRALGL